MLNVWASLGALVPVVVLAQPAPLSLTYGQAQTRFLERSDAVAAANAGVRARQATATSVKTLGRPELEIEAQALDFQKTLYLPLGTLAPVANAFGLPDELRFRFRRFVARPIVTGTLPLYAGGQIGAAKAAAAAQLAQEEAQRDGTVAGGLQGLAQVYFGRQLAAQALDIRRRVVAGITDHVRAARALEREQQIARAQRLQAEAALEEAEREVEKAAADLDAADAALTGLLRADGAVAPATPLTVSLRALPPPTDFTDTALANHPQLRRLQAMGVLAQAGVVAERSKLRPTVYAVGQYNLDRRDTLITDPDFIFGVGAKFKIASGQGRRSQVAAAQESVAQAKAGAHEARAQITTGVAVAWAKAEGARRRHALYDRTIAAADEALRVARLSFRELQGTSRDVTDAELAAGRVRVERARAAYEYVEALAQLLNVSGQDERLPEYLGEAAP